MKIIDRLVIIVGATIAWLVPIAVALSIYEVVARFIFNQPTSWSNISTSALMAALFVLAGGRSAFYGEHISMTYIVGKLKSTAQRKLITLSRLLDVFWGAILVWSGYSLAYSSVFHFRDGRWSPETTGSAWDVPIPALTKSIFCIGFIFFFCEVLRILISGLKKKHSPEN